MAYSNGSNDNFKGVASIYGSKTASYKTSLGWATITTLLGSVVSFFIANGLLEKFSGKGIVPNDLAGAEQFLLAVAVGAGATVILATLTGFPISTTHGLTGAIVGAGLMAVGGDVNFARFADEFCFASARQSVFGGCHRRDYLRHRAFFAETDAHFKRNVRLHRKRICADYNRRRSNGFSIKCRKFDRRR